MGGRKRSIDYVGCGNLSNPHQEVLLRPWADWQTLLALSLFCKLGMTAAATSSCMLSLSLIVCSSQHGNQALSSPIYG